MTDHPVYVDGRLISATQFRERERHARAIRKLENDTVMIGVDVAIEKAKLVREIEQFVLLDLVKQARLHPNEAARWRWAYDLIRRKLMDL